MAVVEQPRLVMWDLHDGNTIVNPEAGEVKAIIDGDRALWGDPLMEFYFRQFNRLSERWRSVYRSHAEGGAAHVENESRDATVRVA